MSKIEWTERTWNPTTGCNKVSQGCKNCYAEKMHKRLMALKPEKYSQPFLAGVQTHPDELIKPLMRKKPTMWFVNSMSDLFHEDVPFDFIDEVFAVMDCCPQHTFQILTKRADRMFEYFHDNRSWRVGDLKRSFDSSDYDLNAWPLTNVWLGVSCEDQATANERIKWLLGVPAEVRFLSCEPLLGPINLDSFLPIMERSVGSDIHWVITGGESGPNARPVHPDWVRSLRDQCAAAGVPFFFKQWGEWLPINQTDDSVWATRLPSKTGHIKVGKTKSGHLLDGAEHHEFPNPVTI